MTEFFDKITEYGFDKKEVMQRFLDDEQFYYECFEQVIKDEAFDELGKNRATLLSSFEGIIDIIQSSNKKGLDGQVNLFDINVENKEENYKKVKLFLNKYKKVLAFY